MRARGLCAEATMHRECITIYIFCPLSVCFSHATLCCVVLCLVVTLTSELKSNIRFDLFVRKERKQKKSFRLQNNSICVFFPQRKNLISIDGILVVKIVQLDFATLQSILESLHPKTVFPRLRSLFILS